MMKNMEMKRLLLSLLAVLTISTHVKAEKDEETGEYDVEKTEEEESENMNKKEEQAIKSNPAYYSSPSQIGSVTGFYAGIDLGIDNLKNRIKKKKTDQSTETTTSEDKKETEKSKSKIGFSGDIFTGYNFQIGRFFLGLEASIDVQSGKNKIDSIESDSKEKSEVAIKKKYSFGIAPRVGGCIAGGLFGYLNGGPILTNYKLNKKKTSNNETKKPKKSTNKTSFFLGIGLEQSFGALFVRGECSKIFRKTILANQTGDKVTADSYKFKIGGGYRF